MDCYSIVMYREPENDNVDFECIATQTYQILQLFNKFPQQYRPNYLKTSKLSNAILFNWSYENFSELLKKSTNNNFYNQAICELGYRFGFFSSTDKKDCFGYSIHVGDTKFSNTIVINIGSSFDMKNKDNSNLIDSIFCECVNLFKPFYACVSNSQFHEGLYYNLKTKIPNNIHWLNYFSKGIVKTIGNSKIKLIAKKNNIKYNDGFLKLQDVAIESLDEKGINLKDKISKEILGQ